ncbi:hypothetical protein [uncultured Clostridium sp.]|nr:hypothetical protein [uncultured Clostridium sp.]
MKEDMREYEITLKANTVPHNLKIYSKDELINEKIYLDESLFI